MLEALGHYRILEQIGSGGMGVVYRAYDDRLEREVAVKVLASNSLPDEHARRRFRREALALSKLNHPNIATIHDFATFDNVDVLVMEHIAGQDLDELAKQGPLAEREVVRLGRQLVTALEAAHDHGVIHCDLKPGNVRVTSDGRLKVLDFGLARALQLGPDATTASVTGSAGAGTLPYMAPEQLTSGALDQRTDIYGAGAVLFEMATGRRVHAELTAGRLVAAIVNEPTPSARAVNSHVSERLDQILRKALDRDPQLRYQSARELNIDLERLEEDRASIEPPVVTRRRAAIAAAVAGLLMLAGWAGYREWPRRPPIQPHGPILVADFENATADPELGSMILESLTVQLQQSTHLNVLSRERVIDALERMERSQRDPLDVDTAVELCQREAIPRLLSGTVRKRGEATWIAVMGMDSRSREVLFTESTELNREAEWFRGLDDLAQKVRRKLLGSFSSEDEPMQPLDKVTTRSISALRLYSRGVEQLARGDPDDALRLLEGALKIDPRFAMAHRQVARVYETLGNPVQEQDHLARAYEYRDSLSQREKLRVEASYYRGRGDYQQAVTSLTGATNLFPLDGEAKYELALAYADTGATSKAIDSLETTLREDPLVTVAYGDLVRLLVEVQKYEKADAVYKEARARNIHAPKLNLMHGLALLCDLRASEARTALEPLQYGSEVYAGIARLYLRSADILEGRLQAAEQRLQADIVLDRGSGALAAEVRRRDMLAQILALRGDRVLAKAQAVAALDDRAERLGADEWGLIGTMFVRAGDLRRADEPLRALRRIREHASSATVETNYHNLAGAIALARGRRDWAVQEFTAAAAHYPRAVATRGLAQAYAAQGDWLRARDEWTHVIQTRGEFLPKGLALDWVIAHLELARACRHLGDLATARREYDWFLARWRDGDDVPLRREAEAERRSLPSQ